MNDAQAALEDHTGQSIEEINSSQRVFLLAEEFDPAVLLAAEWLHEGHGVDIRCYRLQISQENGNDYLSCNCIYPPLEIASLTRRGSALVSQDTDDWPTIVGEIQNEALRTFCSSELAGGRENRSRYKQLIYRVDGKRRFWVSCRSDYAYVEQWGRFEADIEFWGGLISRPESVGTRRHGNMLRFQLVTRDDFQKFHDAWRTTLDGVTFSAVMLDDQEIGGS